MNWLDSLFQIFKKKSLNKPDFLLVGLGNPGLKYEKTRHNVGFRTVDQVSASLNGVQTGEQFKATFQSGILSGQKRVLILKPLTFMNKSGEAIHACLDFFSLDLQALLIIVDDFNIPLGSIRFRQSGSDGGHNGLKSIAANLGNSYPRLRVGIGPKPVDQNIIDFVLGDFSSDEETKLQKIIPETGKAIQNYILKGNESSFTQNLL